jgi:acyl-CoA thioester hydrolase
MAKPEGWRLNPASYHSTAVLQTRFQDMDINGHLNNVAFAALFETARVTLNREARAWESIAIADRPMLASIAISYLHEGMYPGDVAIGSGIGAIGTASWTAVQAMFQNGHCLATCDSVVVFRAGGKPVSIPDEFRSYLETQRVSGG